MNTGSKRCVDRGRTSFSDACAKLERIFKRKDIIKEGDLIKTFSVNRVPAGEDFSRIKTIV